MESCGRQRPNRRTKAQTTENRNMETPQTTTPKHNTNKKPTNPHSKTNCQRTKQLEDEYLMQTCRQRWPRRMSHKDDATKLKNPNAQKPGDTKRPQPRPKKNAYTTTTHGHKRKNKTCPQALPNTGSKRHPPGNTLQKEQIASMIASDARQDGHAPIRSEYERGCIDGQTRCKIAPRNDKRQTAQKRNTHRGQTWPDMPTPTRTTKRGRQSISVGRLTVANVQAAG